MVVVGRSVEKATGISFEEQVDRGECCGVERNEARREFWSCYAFIEREGVKFHHDFIGF